VSQSSLVSPPNRYTGEDARRSTRIDRSVPLIVFGQNRMGEPFVERTVSTSLNLHGCRYPSRHDYGIGSWVTLQAVGLNVEPKPPAVRARVRSVHTSQSSRELQQVGVELENPGNVWGVVTPPQDWTSSGSTNAVVAQFATAVAPALSPEPINEKPEEPPAPVEHKMADVATFPSPSPVASKPQPPKPAEAPKSQRVVITPDGLLAALQGKLDQAAEKAAEAAVAKKLDEAAEKAAEAAVAKKLDEAAEKAAEAAVAKKLDEAAEKAAQAAVAKRVVEAAEKAAQAAVAKRVDEAVREALSSIDDLRKASVREVEELFPARVEAMNLSSKVDFSGEVALDLKEQMEKYRGQAEEMAQRLEKQAAELRRELANSKEFLERMTRAMEPRINARLNEALARATLEFEGATARSGQRRYEMMLENTQALVQEALLKLDARSAEVQAMVQSAVNSALGAFQRQTDLHVNAVLSETQDRATAALSSLEAENRTACEARRLEIETEVARAAERSTDQFRKGMKAFLYSCLVAAVSAVDEHSKSTLEGLTKENGKTLFEGETDSGTQDEREITPDADIDPLTH